MYWVLLSLSLGRLDDGQNKQAALRTMIRAYLTVLCHSEHTAHLNNPLLLH